jgi:hypothetical protein
MLDWVVDFTAGTWGLIRAILLAAFTVLLTAAVARQWQQRNWLVQQRISDQEKLSAETKKLFDDFVALSSKRRFRSQRLFWSLKAKDPIRIADARKAYDEVLYEWNDADLSWQVRFVKNLESGTYILALDVARPAKVESNFLPSTNVYRSSKILIWYRGPYLKLVVIFTENWIICLRTGSMVIVSLLERWLKANLKN